MTLIKNYMLSKKFSPSYNNKLIKSFGQRKKFHQVRYLVSRLSVTCVWLKNWTSAEKKFEELW